MWLTETIRARDQGPALKDGSRPAEQKHTGFPIGLLFVAALALLLSPFPCRAADPATVTFSLDFPNSDPDHYSISVDSEGHAKYECTARSSEASDERQTYRMEFEFSPAGRERVFDLAAKAHFFSGKLDSGKHNLAFTGAKKLTYRDGQRSYTADYNYSALPPVQELTAFFQNVAATLDFGRRLAYFHRYQKLALDDELKRMEAQATSDNLAELQAVQPILQEILEDASVINVVRARAERLIEMGKAASTSGK
jgi:hypothetical protein